MELNVAQLKRVKQIELEMLKEFVKICEILDLQYYIVGGTLLGAVRHKGFIPWDDDIDVALPRNDYEIFVEKANDMLNEPFFLQNHRTDKDMIFPYSKIRNSNTTFIEARSKNSKMNQGVWIDVFPLDFKTNNRVAYKVESLMVSLINMRIGEEQEIEDDKKRTPIVKVVRKIVFRLLKLRFPRVNTAAKAIDRIYSSTKNSDILVNKGGAYREREEVPKEWFDVGTTVYFEGITLKGPKEPDKYLEHMYGDYMKLPPIEKRVSVHDIEIIDLDTPYTYYQKMK